MHSRRNLLGGEMKRFCGMWVAAVSLVAFGSEGFAQGSDSFSLPAEFPPASYTGRQYVDSRGCAYVRAGIDGQVTWIPRVTRDRKVICGQTPTLTGSRATAAAAPAKTPEPEQITITNAKPVSGIQPKRVTRAVGRAQPAKLTIAPTPHVNLRPGKPVTPQTSPTTVVAPRHVYEKQIQTNGLYVPKGYEPVWTDDRLNPRRQHQTLAGKARMDALWTKTVPRTLREADPGR